MGETCKGMLLSKAPFIPHWDWVHRHKVIYVKYFRLSHLGDQARSLPEPVAQSFSRVQITITFGDICLKIISSAEGEIITETWIDVWISTLEPSGVLRGGPATAVVAAVSTGANGFFHSPCRSFWDHKNNQPNEAAPSIKTHRSELLFLSMQGHGRARICAWDWSGVFCKPSPTLTEIKAEGQSSSRSLKFQEGHLNKL